MIPAGVFNQTSLSGNPVWYLDFRPTNAAKPLTGDMGVGWHTVNVPFDVYTPLGGDYGFGQTNVPISVSMPNLIPDNNGSEKISVAVSSQDAGGGSYAMLGYMFDPTTGTTFDRSRERSLVLGFETDLIWILFLNAGTYKMYINSNMPSSFIPEFTSYFGTHLQSESGTESEGAVSFSVTDRTLTSSTLDDPGWYTNDVEGECVFTVEAGWFLGLEYISGSELAGALVGQIAIEKIY